MHTVAVLQAYQADLLTDLYEAGEVDLKAVRELRHATDLSLLATKEMARSIGWSMAAMVADIHVLPPGHPTLFLRSLW